MRRVKVSPSGVVTMALVDNDTVQLSLVDIEGLDPLLGRFLACLEPDHKVVEGIPSVLRVIVVEKVCVRPLNGKEESLLGVRLPFGLLLLGGQRERKEEK